MSFEPMKVLKDSTDTLRFHVPILIGGAISAVTHKLRTPTEDFGDSWEAASYDTADTALTAAASKGDETIDNGGSGLTIGNRYHVSHIAQDAGSDNEGFLVEVAAQVTSTDLYQLRQPLPLDLPVGAPIVGRTVTHALTAAETAELGFGLVQWKVTIGGQVYRFDQAFEVVDQVVAYALNRDLLLELIPRLHDLRFPTDQTWEKGIRAAWYADLAPALAEAGIIVGRIESWEVLNAWHAQLVFARTVQQLGDQFDERFINAQWERADVMRRQALKSRDWWVSEGKSTTRDAHPGEPTEQAPRGVGIKINL